jgi:membrane protein YqaA with SNARE-associated domain
MLSGVYPSGGERLSRAISISTIWGFAEATLFFVVPDVWVGWIAMRRPRRVVAMWLAASAGGILGAAILHIAVRSGWDPDRRFRSLPGVQAGDIEDVREAIAADPTRAFAMGAVTGVPVKIYVAEAARAGLPLSRTVALVALNRVPRIGVSGLVGVTIGALAPRVGLGRPVTAVLYIVGWFLFYAWYWLMRRESPSAPPALAQRHQPVR